MEAESIFCKNIDLFSQDNKIGKQKKSQFRYKVLNNMENIIDFYKLEEKDLKRDVRHEYKDPSEEINNIERRDFSFRKLSEPLLVMMINCIVKNKRKNANTNAEKFSLKSYIDYKDYTVKQISKLPEDINIKIKDSAIYEYDYELTKFLELFFEKIDEILNWIIVPNVFLDEISGDILSNLNDIINRIKSTLATNDIKKRYYDSINLYSNDLKNKGVPDELLNSFKNFFYSQIESLELSKLYNNFEKYNDLDKLVKEEFSRLNALTEKIYNQFEEDKKSNPDIYKRVSRNPKIKKSILDPVIDYPEHYKLDRFCTRSDLLLILKNDDLANELLSSLEPQIASKKNIDTLSNENTIRKYSLKEFISIYKQDAYNKFNLFLDENKSCTNTEMYSEYEKIIKKLCKNITLAEKATYSKINLANKSCGKAVFDRSKNIIDTIYKCILDPEILNINLEDYNLTLDMLKDLQKLTEKNKNPLIIDDDIKMILSNLINSNTTNNHLNKDLLPNDLLKLLDKLLLFERILNPNLKSLTVTSDSLALIEVLETKEVKKIFKKYKNKKVNKIDVYLLILSNENIIDKILSFINTDKIDIISYHYEEIFNLYPHTKINLNKIYK